MKKAFYFLVLLPVAGLAVGRHPVDLSGKWRFMIDREDIFRYSVFP